MENKLTETQALSAINSSNVEIVGKTIISRGGFKGLKACKAFDCLCNYYGYTGRILPEKNKK